MPRRYCHVESEAAEQRCLVGVRGEEGGGEGGSFQVGFRRRVRSFTPSRFFIAVVCPPTCEQRCGCNEEMG